MFKCFRFLQQNGNPGVEDISKQYLYELAFKNMFSCRFNLFDEIKNLIWSVKFLRNASAHNNCKNRKHLNTVSRNT